jgi:hypothetical protein
LLEKKGQKAALQRKSTMEKKERITYSRLRVLMQKGGMKTMTVMMSENPLCRSQVQVTAFRGTEGYVPKSIHYFLTGEDEYSQD